MKQITIHLTEDTKTALLLYSEHQGRDPRYQAGMIIRDALMRLGYLPPIKKPNEQELSDNQ